jgi:hypothetical protein
MVYTSVGAVRFYEESLFLNNKLEWFLLQLATKLLEPGIRFQVWLVKKIKIDSGLKSNPVLSNLDRNRQLTTD